MIFAIGFNLAKAKVIENILEDYKIDQVHIHQFDCIPSVFPACINKNVPYVSFVHTGIEGIYNWFEEQYFDYKGMFTLFFKNASKIISITEEAKKENKKRYEIPDYKYLIINNSIKFSEDIINNNNVLDKVEKFLIISRLDEEKRSSLINAINIFEKYSTKHPEASLTIVGDGSIKEDIIKKCENIIGKVTFLGKRTDIYNIILANDIVIGLDRCILEAIVLKRLSIVSGYNDIKEMVVPENIEIFAKENFSGRKMPNRTIDFIIEELEQLNPKKINQIVQQNFEFAYKNLNLDKNIYIYEGEAPEYQLDTKEYLKLEEYLVEKMNKKEQQINIKFNEIKKQQEDLLQKNKDTIDILNSKVNEYKQLYENEKSQNEKIVVKIRKKIYSVYRKLLKNNSNK